MLLVISVITEYEGMERNLSIYTTFLLVTLYIYPCASIFFFFFFFFRLFSVYCMGDFVSVYMYICQRGQKRALGDP